MISKCGATSTNSMITVYGTKNYNRTWAVLHRIWSNRKWHHIRLLHIRWLSPYMRGKSPQMDSFIYGAAPYMKYICGAIWHHKWKSPHLESPYMKFHLRCSICGASFMVITGYDTIYGDHRIWSMGPLKFNPAHSRTLEHKYDCQKQNQNKCFRK